VLSFFFSLVREGHTPQKGPQISEGSALDAELLRQPDAVAGAFEHPLRYFQRSSVRCSFPTASKESLSSFCDGFVYPDNLATPRMPWIEHFPIIGIVGV